MNEIKRGLLGYLIGDESFEQFAAWLSDIAWDPIGKFNEADVELIREIQLRVAEFTGGYLSEDDLRAVIREAAGITPRVVSRLWQMENAPVRPQPPSLRTGSSQSRRKVAF